MKKLICFLFLALFAAPSYAAIDKINWDRNEEVLVPWSPLKITLVGDEIGPRRMMAFPFTKKVAGLELGIIGAYTDTIYGVQLAPVFGYGTDIYGLQAAPFAGSDDFYGARITLWGGGTVNGVQIGVINVNGNLNGVQIGIFNVGARDTKYNSGQKTNGIQIGIINYTEDLKGIQIGVLNYCKTAWLPFTIGLNFKF